MRKKCITPVFSRILVQNNNLHLSTQYERYSLHRNRRHQDRASLSLQGLGGAHHDKASSIIAFVQKGVTKLLLHCQESPNMPRVMQMTHLCVSHYVTVKSIKGGGQVSQARKTTIKKGIHQTPSSGGAANITGCSSCVRV